MKEDHHLNITRRNLPHWSINGSTYFVTFRLRTGILNQSERAIVRDQILFGDSKYYLLVAGVVMPDHVHLILKPNSGLTLSKILQGIKGATANKINRTRKTQGPLWQSESFDRILRDEQEFHEKLQYIADNPAKAGLISPHETYDTYLTGSEFKT